MEIVRLPKVSRRHYVSGAQPQQSQALNLAAPAAAGHNAERSHLRLVGGAGKPEEGSTVSDTLSAPERIVAETRAAFRKDALAYMERALKAGLKQFRLDMSHTTEVDASGLGILVVVQKRSKELGLKMLVARAPQQVRYLLLLTKLEHLFDFEEQA
jgi:anti-anti-sigma regulatory factor